MIHPPFTQRIREVVATHNPIACIPNSIAPMRQEFSLHAIEEATISDCHPEPIRVGEIAAGPTDPDIGKEVLHLVAIDGADGRSSRR